MAQNQTQVSQLFGEQIIADGLKACVQVVYVCEWAGVVSLIWHSPKSVSLKTPRLPLMTVSSID